MFDYKTGQERSDEFIDDYDRLNYYDYISEVTYHNLKYFYSKFNKIHFTNFDINSTEHKFIAHIALRTIIFTDNGKIWMPIKNPFKYFSFIIKEFGFKSLKYFKYTTKNGNINIDEVLEYESKQNRINKSMFSDIYSAYYEKGKMIYAV